MNLPGSRQIGLAKAFLMRFPWEHLKPHPEWAAWSDSTKARDEYEEPYAAGIPGKLRIVYAPDRHAVTCVKLDPKCGYNAGSFDPVSGLSTNLGLVHADATGSISLTPPQGTKNDWVLVLETK